MKRLLLVLAVTLGYVSCADACPKLGHRLFKGRVRSVVHNVVDAPFKVAQQKPVRKVLGFTATNGCPNGACPAMK